MAKDGAETKQHYSDLCDTFMRFLGPDEMPPEIEHRFKKVDA